MQLQDYINDVLELVHDTTNSSWPLSRVISRINDARLDVSRDMACVKTLVTGVQLIQGVETYSLNGAVAGANIVSGGSNYGPTGTVIPLTFDAAPMGGVTALAVGNVTSGVITSVTMSQWGVGYTSQPNIAVGGAGSGAVLTPVSLFKSNPLSTTVGNPLFIHTLSYNWNQQRRSLSYLNWFLFNAYLRAWQTPSFVQPPSAFFHDQQDRVLYVQAPPDQNYLSEWMTVYQTAPLVQATDVDYINDPYNRAVQFQAAAYLLMKFQNGGQVANMQDRYTLMVPRMLETSGRIVIPNPYHKTFQRRVALALN